MRHPAWSVPGPGTPPFEPDEPLEPLEPEEPEEPEDPLEPEAPLDEPDDPEELPAPSLEPSHAKTIAADAAAARMSDSGHDQGLGWGRRKASSRRRELSSAVRRIEDATALMERPMTRECRRKRRS